MAQASTLVLETCQRVCEQATHVHIDDDGIQRLAQSLTQEDLARITSPASFDSDLHYVDRSSPEGEARTVQYLLVVDALNFCFWPEEGLEYEHLARGVKAALQSDARALDAERLAQCTGERVQALLGWPRPVPLQEERARLLREVGQGLLRWYGGSAAELVRAAGGSAAALVQLVAEAFPGFRDHAVYKGRQVFLYKRAQIFVGDVYGALGGQGLGAFADLHTLTMFADYRVPVVLQVAGVLKYSAALDAQVRARQEIEPGSAQEVELRAATVVATERLRRAVQARLPAGGPAVLAVPLDWWLWEFGEARRQEHPPHHRTLTIFY